MKTCTTHHHACDCREAAHAEEVAELKARIEALEAELKLFTECDGYNCCPLAPENRRLAERVRELEEDSK